MLAGERLLTRRQLVGVRGNRFFFSYPVVFLLFALACAVTVSRQYVAGAVLFIAIVCLELFLCSDLTVLGLPLLLMIVFLLNCYDSFDTFIHFAWGAPIVIFALLYNLVVYRESLKVGRTLYGWIAVSLALLLGGVGTVSAADYFSPMSLYYVLGLGVGMLAFYLLVRSRFAVQSVYTLFSRVACIMYLVGLLAVINVVAYYYHKLSAGWTLSGAMMAFQASNNLSTFLMFAMPFPIWYALKQNPFHAASAFIFYLGIVATGSRAGFVLGTVEFLICLAFWSRYGGRIVRFFCFSIVSTGALLAILLVTEIETLIPGFNFVSMEEMRYKAIGVACDSFLSHPVFGIGLKNNALDGIYSPKKGALCWFHMYVPQIIASMGSVGIVAYLIQFLIRMSLIVRRHTTPLRLTLGISYIGILLMSQINPGEFCPIPYGMMTVVIFALLEQLGETERLAYRLAPEWAEAFSA